MTRQLAAAWLLVLAHSPASAEQLWAEVEHPVRGQVVREPIGLVEVRGWAGSGLRGYHDVVLVIDRSGSTWNASGVDVDGDEKIGRNVIVEGAAGQRRRVVTDPDDTIAEAELVAARRLVERLDAETTRMGIVTFAGIERVPARIGTTVEGLLAAIEGLPDKPEKGGTYLYGAIIASMRLLKEAPIPPGQHRQRSIILLSDGLPNTPPPRASAEKAAVRAASYAAQASIAIYSFALGTEVAARPRVFAEMAEANGGELLFVERPGEIIDFVPHMSLTKLSHIEIENLTTRRAARAVRLFPDGTFDGYAPLAEGENLLRVTIHGEAGGSLIVEIPVAFEQIPADAPGARRRLQVLLEELRQRTLETRLAEEARSRRAQALKRSLEITVERADRDRADGDVP